MAMPNEDIAQLLVPLAMEMNIDARRIDKLAHAASMMKERVYFLQDIPAQDTISFNEPHDVDYETFNKSSNRN